jgi:hypothetical protein
MFVGHYSTALVAATHPKAPGLGTLFVAGQLIDLGFFSFVLMGWERMRITPGITAMSPLDLYDMPWTHSLLGACVWGLAFAVLVGVLTRNRTGGMITGAVVVSHWLLDLLVHRPDLTLAGAPPMLGLGLWNHPLVEMPLEIGMTLGALWLYLRATRATGRSIAAPSMAIFLLVLQAYNWFGPQPTAYDPGMAVMALAAYGAAIAMAWWLGLARVHRQTA